MAFTDTDVANEIAELFGDSGVLTLRKTDADTVPIVFGHSATAKKHWHEHRRDLRLAFEMGLSLRASARFARCSVATARIWIRAFRGPHVCGCGHPATHQGWCKVRFSTSKKRQAFMTRWQAARLAKNADVDEPHEGG